MLFVEKLTEMLHQSIQWSGGSEDAVQLHEQLTALQTLSRTGVVDLQAACPKGACVFLGCHPVVRTTSNPECRNRERQDEMPRRPSKSAETLESHELSKLKQTAAGNLKRNKSRTAALAERLTAFQNFWHAPQSEAERKLPQASRKESMQSNEKEKTENPNPTGESHGPKRKNTMPTIDEQPEECTSTTDDDVGWDSEGSLDDFGAMEFSEVPEDLPAVAPPVAGVVKSTPQRRG
eukprot:Skav219241  [mRNA]  locus=scaffold1242:142992:169078:- [translate_table: standard]